MMTLSPTDKAQRTIADAVLVICGVLALSSLWPTPQVAHTEAHAQPTAIPTPMIILTATPPLPTAQPTIVPTPQPTDPPAPVVQVEPPTPVVIYVEVPAEIAPVVEAPPDPPVSEAHEVAPGVEHGISPAPRPHDVGTNGGMPAARPQP